MLRLICRLGPEAPTDTTYIVNHTELNPDLGTLKAFDRMVAAFPGNRPARSGPVFTSTIAIGRMLAMLKAAEP
jgi:hypothetical protein